MENYYINVMIVLRNKEFTLGRSAARFYKTPGNSSIALKQGSQGVTKIGKKIKNIFKKTTKPLKDYTREFKESPSETIKKKPFTSLGAAAAVVPIPGTIVALPIGMAADKASVHVIDAAKKLTEKRISFVLVGSGVEKKRLVQRVADEGIKNVFFFDPIPKTQVPSLLSLMDLLFIGWNKNPLYRFGISPNKIFDYMMSGKPIVHAVEAANDPVVEAGCGISVEPENPDAIADAIMKLASISASEREEMGRKGHDYVLKYHTYSVLSQKFVDVMNKISK